MKDGPDGPPKFWTDAEEEYEKMKAEGRLPVSSVADMHLENVVDGILK